MPKMSLCVCVFHFAAGRVLKAETSVEEWRGHWVKRRFFLFVSESHMWASDGRFTCWLHNRPKIFNTHFRIQITNAFECPPA